MANNPEQEFGKRKPVSVPASPRLRSAAGETFGPRCAAADGHVCGRQRRLYADAEPQLRTTAECGLPRPARQYRVLFAEFFVQQPCVPVRLRRQLVAQQLLQRAIRPRAIHPRALPIPVRTARNAAASARSAMPSASPAAEFHAAHHLPRTRRLACHRRSIGFTFHTIDGERYWDERAYYAFTLNEIERRIEGAHRRDRSDVRRTGRPRDQRRKISAPVENTRSLLAAAVRELAAARCQSLRPAGPELRRLEPGETAGVQRGYADLDLRSGGFSVDLARTGDGAQHRPEARRPVQFNP